MRTRLPTPCSKPARKAVQHEVIFRNRGNGVEKVKIKLRYPLALAVVLIAAAWQSRPVKAEEPKEAVIYVYTAHDGRALFLCETTKEVAQVIQCANGNTIILTQSMARELVLSTMPLGVR